MLLEHDLAHLGHPGIHDVPGHVVVARYTGDVERLHHGAAILDVDRQGIGEVEYALLQQAQGPGPF